MPSFEQLESDYRIQFPEDFLLLRARVKKSGVLTITDEYTLLEPDDIIERKPGVLWPELIPVIQNRYDGCAICLRAPLVEGEGYYWDWFDGETGCVGSLGRDFSAVLRTVLIDLYSVSFKENDPVRASALTEQSRRMVEIPGVVPAERTAVVEKFRNGLSVEGLRNACGIQNTVPVFSLVDVDFYRRLSRSERALEICEHLLSYDPRFLNAHWCLGALKAIRGRPDEAACHFAQLAEGEWGRIWPSHNLEGVGTHFWHPDLAVIAEFLQRNAELYKKISGSSIIGEIFISGSAADGAAWSRTLAKAIDAEDWLAARIIALNGIIDSDWPRDGWPRGHVRNCAQALVLACERLGFAGRVDGMLELWLTSPEAES